MNRFLLLLCFIVSTLFAAFAKSDEVEIGGLIYRDIGRGEARVVPAARNSVVELRPESYVQIGTKTLRVTEIGNGGRVLGEPESFGENLTKVILPETVKIIEFRAFDGAKNLTEVYLPSSLQEIRQEAFRGCVSLKKIVIPSNTIFKSLSSLTDAAIFSNSGITKYVSFSCHRLNFKESRISPTAEIYIIPGIEVDKKYESSVRYIFDQQITTFFGGAYMKISTNYDEFKLKSVRFGERILQMDKNGLYKIADLRPEGKYEFLVDIEYEGRDYTVNIPFETKKPNIAVSLSSTQTTISGKVSYSEDETLKPSVVLVKLHSNYIKLDENSSFHISNLMPNKELTFNVLAQYGGEYYSVYNCEKEVKKKTLPITSSLDRIVTPTSIIVTPYSGVGDAEFIRNELYFSDEHNYNQKVDTTIFTGLEPQTKYGFKHVVYFKIGDGKEYNQSFDYTITTKELKLETIEATITSQSSARLKANVNVVDENGFGFEWRRIDAPDIVPSTHVSSLLLNGKIIGTLRNLKPDVYYKYRPYYKSRYDKLYFGDWVGFYTEDSDVYYEPEIKTITPKTLSDNVIQFEGFVIEGTEDVIEKGFEYWLEEDVNFGNKSNSEHVKVKANGNHMIVQLSGLEGNAKYNVRSYAITETEIYYSEVITFTTQEISGEPNIIVDKNLSSTTIVGYYNIRGIRRDTPYVGFNIVLFSNGTYRKMILSE